MLAQEADIVADILIASNLTVVSAVNAAAEPEGSFAQQNGPILVRAALHFSFVGLLSIPVIHMRHPAGRQRRCADTGGRRLCPLAQQAVSATAGNPNAVSSLTPVAEPEGSFAQQNGPAPVRSALYSSL